MNSRLEATNVVLDGFGNQLGRYSQDVMNMIISGSSCAESDKRAGQLLPICGYHLAGNVSSTCPECVNAVESASKTNDARG